MICPDSHNLTNSHPCDLQRGFLKSSSRKWLLQTTAWFEKATTSHAFFHFSKSRELLKNHSVSM